MQQISRQSGCGTIHFDRAMFRGSAPGSLVAAEQTQHTIRIPITVCDPASHEPDLPRKISARKPFRIGRKKSKNRVLQFLGNFFIGIQRQNPRLCGMRQYEILLFAKTLPRMANNFSSKRLHDLLGAVLNFLVEDHNNLAGPLRRAPQASADAVFFRAGNDADGNGQFVHYRFGQLISESPASQSKKLKLSQSLNAFHRKNFVL